MKLKQLIGAVLVAGLLLLGSRPSSALDAIVARGFIVYTGYYYSPSWWTFLMMGGQPCHWTYAQYDDGSGFYSDSCNPSSNIAWF